MNPIRSHNGPERRKSERNRLVIFWSVIAICAVVSTGALIVAAKAVNTSHHAEKAHCVLVKFLVGSNLRNQASINEHPPGTAQQRDAVVQTTDLIMELRATGIHCIRIPPKALKPKVKK